MTDNRLRTACLSLCLFFSLSSQQPFTISAISDDGQLNVFAPYRQFHTDFEFLSSMIHGDGLVSDQTGRVTSDVQSVRYQNGTVTITLNSFSRFSTADILFTFKHYRDYYEQTGNNIYYMFGQVRDIRTRGNRITFNLREPGVYHRQMLSFPILRERSATNAISQNMFRRPENYNGFGPYRVEAGARDGLFVLRQRAQNNSRISQFQVSVKSTQEQIISDVIRKQTQFFKFNYLDKLVNSDINYQANFRRRLFRRHNNHLITLLMNPKAFPQKERLQFTRLINRQKIWNQYLKDQGQLTDGLFEPGSRYYYARARKPYEPVPAIAALKKNGFFVNAAGILQKRNFRPEIRIFYPKNNPLLRHIANEIVLDFAEIPIYLKAKAVAAGELDVRLKAGKYDLVLMDWFYHDYEYLPLFQQFDRYGLVQSNVIEKHIERLKRIRDSNVITPIIQQVQDITNRDAIIYPMFYLRFYQAIMDKRLRSFTRLRQEGEEYYYDLNPVNNWEFRNE